MLTQEQLLHWATTACKSRTKLANGAVEEINEDGLVYILIPVDRMVNGKRMASKTTYQVQGVIQP